MTILKIIRHIGIIIASLIVLLGVPLWCTGYISSLFSDDPDAVASASVILDQPSGSYIVLINKNLHKDEENLEDWVTFFSTGYILYIFEDLSCSAASADLAGIEMAKSFQSKLPEHQMQLETEDSTLLLSRADEGLFDIIIMSKEFADNYHSDTAYTDSVIVIEIEKKEEQHVFLGKYAEYLNEEEVSCEN